MENNQPQTSKSIAKNAFYGVLTWILPLGLSFAATPVIIETLGDEDYGIYVLVLGFIGYSFTFSIGRAITKYVAEYRASGETEKIRDVVSATFFVNVVVGLLGFALICLSANWIVRQVFKIGEESQNETVTALYIAAAIIFLTMLVQVFNAVLQGIHRFDVYSKIYNASSFALLFGNLLLALLGCGLLILLGWNLLIIGLNCVVAAVSAKRLLPEFGISFRLKRETLRMVLKYSAGVIGYQIFGNLVLLFERGWIVREFGEKSLAYYVLPMTLALYVHGFISSLILVVFPLASELKNDTEKLLNLYTKATKIVCFLTVFMVTTLAVESDLFLKLWVGEVYAEHSAALLIVHSLTFGLLAISSVSRQMTEGLGFPGYNLKLSAFAFVVSIFLMLTLARNYGSTGVGFARLIGFGATFFSIFYVEKWLFGNVQTKFWAAIISKLAVSALLCGIGIKVLISYFPQNWASFVSAIAVGGSIYCAVLWLLNYFSFEEKLLLKRVLVNK